MIIDKIENAKRYQAINALINNALDYLLGTDLKNIVPGKYEIDGDNLFVIVQEYKTLDAANEQMESHKKYIDVQYMITGEEFVGHSIFDNQAVSKEYDEAADFMLFGNAPSFFTKFEAGMFMIFFPTDLHMPCIKINETATVKKAVIKVKIQ